MRVAESVVMPQRALSELVPRPFDEYPAPEFGFLKLGRLEQANGRQKEESHEDRKIKQIKEAEPAGDLEYEVGHRLWLSCAKYPGVTLQSYRREAKTAAKQRVAGTHKSCTSTEEARVCAVGRCTQILLFMSSSNN